METEQPSSNQSPMETETQPRQISSNKSRLFVVVTISVLLTAMIAGSAVYFWQKSANEKAINSLEQKISSLEEQISTTRNVKPPLTTDPISNWKKYNGSFYEFKYPSYLNTQNIGSGPHETAIETIDFYRVDTSVIEYRFYVYSLNTTSLSLTDWIENHSGVLFPPKMTEQPSWNINSIKVYRYEYEVPAPNNPKSALLIFSNKEKAYSLQITSTTIDKETVAKQILSTLQFID